MHTPLKPHVCEVITLAHSITLLLNLTYVSDQICKKSFKRPQDLKKHEKIHTEEHHQQHKHSKAITVVDPAYVSRVRGESAPRGSEPRSKYASDSPGLKDSDVRAKSSSSSASDGSSFLFLLFATTTQHVLTAAHLTLLPTPSPELGHPTAHSHSHHASSHQMFMQSNQPLTSWDTLRSDSTGVTTGSKRSHDYGVDDFFTDMKKRRVNPSYDPR